MMSISYPLTSVAQSSLLSLCDLINTGPDGEQYVHGYADKEYMFCDRDYLLPNLGRQKYRPDKTLVASLSPPRQMQGG
jgi:hypothetical protein